MTTRAQHIDASFSAARSRSALSVFIGEAELYCDNSGCTFREVVITIKEYDGPTPAKLTCPACRHQLKLHHIRTLEEAEEERARAARCSVNEQRYRRDNPGAFAIPGSAFLDERLP